jgi:hypothetical protein
METITKISAVVGLICIVAVLLGYPVMLLWNWCLVGAIDGINEIGFFQAIGLNLLTSILFKASVNKND